MRFFYAVALFTLSVILFVTSLVIRNFFSDPDTLTQTVTVSGTAPVTIIDAKELRRIANTETIVASTGSASTSGQEAAPVTIAWGRTSDVMSWVGNSSYQLLTIEKETGAIIESAVTGIEPAVPSPQGSDLWVQEWNGEGTASADLALRKGHTIIITTDGTQPAPTLITVIWNLEVDRTVTTILLYLAGVTGLAGIVAFAWGLWRERRQRRHRQGRMPKPPKPPRWRPSRPSPFAKKTPRRSRRFAGMIAAFTILPVALVGCSTTATPQPTPTPVATGALPFVAVTNQQFERILGSVVGALAAADTKKAENLAANRLAGAALRFRAATYRVQASNPKLGSLFRIPNGTVSLMLPQQTEGWPRSVFAIIDDTESEDAPSVAIFMTQDSPRTNYHVDYTFALEPGVVMPEVPSADYGTSVLAGDTELLSATPAQVAEQYGDLLLNGDKSAFASIFESDTLQEQIGAHAKAERAAAMKGKANFSWTDTIATGVPVVFATSDAGALVALTINEAETVRPANRGAAISTEGAVRVLSGRPSSLRGITANYQYQLLFHIPPIGSADKIRLLGYSYALVSAQEVR